jgi:hypothetical protein
MRISLRLADLRGLEERYPVLQSMRYETSQKFAQDCQQQGLHGILYASAQHPHHSCVCLFKAGLEQTRKLTAFALVERWHWQPAAFRRQCGSRVTGADSSGIARAHT